MPVSFFPFFFCFFLSVFYTKVRHSWPHDIRNGKQTPRLVGHPSAAAAGPGPKSAAGGKESNPPYSCASLRRRLRARPKVGGERRREQSPRPAERPFRRTLQTRPEAGGSDCQREEKRGYSPPSCAALCRRLKARHEVGGERRSEQTPSAPLRRRLRARPEVGGKRRSKRISRQAVHPAATASGPGPKSAARAVARKLPVQLRSPPPPPPGQARSRRREAWRANSPSSCATRRYRLRARPEVCGERRRERTPHPAERPSAAPSGPGRKSAARAVESKLPARRPVLAVSSF